MSNELTYYPTLMELEAMPPEKFSDWVTPPIARNSEWERNIITNSDGKIIQIVFTLIE